MSCSSDFRYGYSFLRISLFLLLNLASQSCDGFRTFGFDIHHRYSDPVKGILGIDELPEKGTRAYYVAMVHRDRIIRGRGLASEADQTALTFAGGNDTYRISSLGLYEFFLHLLVKFPPLSNFFFYIFSFVFWVILKIGDDDVEILKRKKWRI